MIMILVVASRISTQGFVMWKRLLPVKVDLLTWSVLHRRRAKLIWAHGGQFLLIQAYAFNYLESLNIIGLSGYAGWYCLKAECLSAVFALSSLQGTG